MSSRPTWELRKTLSQNKVEKGEYGLVVEGRLGVRKALGSISSTEKKVMHIREEGRREETPDSFCPAAQMPSRYPKLCSLHPQGKQAHATLTAKKRACCKGLNSQNGACGKPYSPKNMSSDPQFSSLWHYLFVCLFVHSFIHSFICLFVLTRFYYVSPGWLKTH